MRSNEHFEERALASDEKCESVNAVVLVKVRLNYSELLDGGPLFGWRGLPLDGISLHQ